MSTNVLVNGNTVETGCYIESQWGQYGLDRVAEVAEGLGWVAPPSDATRVSLPDDPRSWRERAEFWERVAYRYDGPERERRLGKACDAWQAQYESADQIEQWLNSHTQTGFVWFWSDGEFFLSPLCDDGECNDDTCAHWEG